MSVDYDDGPHMIAFGGCICCGQLFSFNPNRVPSTTAINGQREPICAICMKRINCTRVDHGLAPFVILPNAYDPEPVSEVID